jgi:HEAT repeat protein
VLWPWIFVSLLGSGLLEVIRVQRARLRRWRAAAAANGLKVVQASNLWASRSRLVAQADPITVRIEGCARGGTRIVIVVPGQPGFSEVRIRRFDLFKPEALDISIGDEAFDRTFTVDGPMRLLCVLLDAEARRLLLEVKAENSVEIVDGEIRAEMFDDQLPDVLPLLLRLARRFAERTDIKQCLATNARRDPEAGVRLCNLLALVRECAWDPLTGKVLHKACSDPSPRVRLQAAMALGAEGHKVLTKLALHADDDCSAQAVRALGRELPFDRTQAILDGALRKDHVQTAHACLKVLGLIGTTEAVIALARMMAHDQGELAPAAAQALGVTGNAAAEPPLIRALQHERMDIRVAAANALGRVGSVAAVLPLKEAAERSWPGRDLHRAAHQAIAEIQSRLAGATPGQLSLAGAETGQLSLAQDEAGQLSLATHQAGQVSLAPDGPGKLPLKPARGDAE